MWRRYRAPRSGSRLKVALYTFDVAGGRLGYRVRQCSGMNGRSPEPPIGQGKPLGISDSGMCIAFPAFMEHRSEGYLGRAYIDALAPFGQAVELPASQGWLLARPIPDQPDRQDACGPYPLFCCRDWRRLAEDLATLESRLVSCVVIADPFGGYTRADLQAAFPDLVTPFKEHFLVHLDQPLESFIQARHRNYARRALREYQVVRCGEPLTLLDRWNELYAQLIRRHRIRGIAAFSPESFQRQLQVPGVTVFCAQRSGSIEGMQIWLRQGDVAYYHLGAYSDTGYRSRVSYALMWSALQWFAEAGTGTLDLGGAAGTAEREDGLTRFKRGWSNASTKVYLCGRILDREHYARIVDETKAGDAPYFPRYRAPARNTAVLP